MVASVDALNAEVETWRRLASDQPRVMFAVGEAAPCDGRRVLRPGVQHLGDRAHRRRRRRAAISEPARVVRPGGRVVITLPMRGVTPRTGAT